MMAPMYLKNQYNYIYYLDKNLDKKCVTKQNKLKTVYNCSFT